MIDIHCHILPGLDDGPVLLEDSIAMARHAAANGIHSIIATPHIDKSSPVTVSVIQDTVELLNRLLAQENIPVTLYPGAELHSEQITNKCNQWTLNHSSYILIEFPHHYLPADAGQALFQLQKQGLSPIIAHPERNETVMNDPKRLLRLLNPGISLQVTASSITGDFGPTIRECAWHLLEQESTCFIASDAHSTRYRKPDLKKALKKASRLIGKEKAQAMVNDNPQAVLDNRLFR